jgi:hypothetical protein
MHHRQRIARQRPVRKHIHQIRPHRPLLFGQTDSLLLPSPPHLRHCARHDPPAILITGGAKRIGAHIARRFGAAGWHVVIHYGLAAPMQRWPPPSAECTSCDLTDAEAAVAMVKSLPRA